MLKKLLVFVTIMSMMLTMVIPSVNVSAKFTDGTNSYEAIDGGTIVMERLYTATSDSVVNFQFTSHSETDASAKKYNIIVKLNGLKICGPGGKSEISRLELKEGNTYLVTLVFRHYKDDTEGKSTPAKYYLYINGACVVNGGNDANNSSKLIHDNIVQGTNNSNNITTVFVSGDSSATFDMTDYGATISANDENIILDATEKRNDIAFGGYTTKILENMTVSDFLQNVTPATGATISVTRGAETLANDDYIVTGDTVIVTSQNGKVSNKYAVTVDAPVIIEPAVSSTTYSVSNENLISNVYEYTPIDTFINYLTADEGWTLTVKNGEDTVSSSVVTEAMTLVASKGEEEQVYTIDIADKGVKVSSANPGNVALSTPVPPKGSFRGNLVIEMETKVLDTYWTGPKPTGGDAKAAYMLSVGDDGAVSMEMNTNALSNSDSKYIYPTDLSLDDSLSLVFVARPDEDTNKLDYYINGDYISTCSMGSVFSANWEQWRFHSQTAGSVFMVEDLDAYMAAKNIDKIKVDADKVSASFAGKTADKLYLAVYNGNELESLQIADLTDMNFKADVLSIPANTEGKTVKAFLWSSDLTPIDFVKISEQTDILFDREFDS